MEYIPIISQLLTLLFFCIAFYSLLTKNSGLILRALIDHGIICFLMELGTFPICIKITTMLIHYKSLIEYEGIQSEIPQIKSIQSSRGWVKLKGKWYLQWSQSSWDMFYLVWVYHIDMSYSQEEMFYIYWRVLMLMC